jgi:hypothetical protein
MLPASALPPAAPAAPAALHTPAPVPPSRQEPAAPTEGRRRGDTESRQVRRESIGIHLAFAGMHPLIRRTRHLSLNAILASARLAERGQPFAIVAKELNTVGRDLEALIGEIERMFRTLVVGIAQWGKAELRLAYLRRSLAVLERIAGPARAPGADGRDGNGSPQGAARAATQAAAQPAAGSGHPRYASLTRQLNEHIERLRAVIGRELETIDLVTGKLSGRIDRINWVAVRQCHYTAISAQIEAAQITDDRSGLGSVAADIRALAEDIAQAERQAKDRAIRLRHLLKTRLPLLKQQVRNA